MCLRDAQCRVAVVEYSGGVVKVRGVRAGGVVSSVVKMLWWNIEVVLYK